VFGERLTQLRGAAREYVLRPIWQIRWFFNTGYRSRVINGYFPRNRDDVYTVELPASPEKINPATEHSRAHYASVRIGA